MQGIIFIVFVLWLCGWSVVGAFGAVFQVIFQVIWFGILVVIFSFVAAGIITSIGNAIGWAADLVGQMVDAIRRQATSVPASVIVLTLGGLALLALAATQ